MHHQPLWVQLLVLFILYCIFCPPIIWLQDRYIDEPEEEDKP